MTKQCEMIIGYLVPRSCDGEARSTCIRCGKRVCDEHAAITPAGILCEACHTGEEQPAVAETAPDWVATLPDYHADELVLFDSDDVDDADLFDDLS